MLYDFVWCSTQNERRPHPNWSLTKNGRRPYPKCLFQRIRVLRIFALRDFLNCTLLCVCPLCEINFTSKIVMQNLKNLAKRRYEAPLSSEINILGKVVFHFGLGSNLGEVFFHFGWNIIQNHTTSYNIIQHHTTSYDVLWRHTTSYNIIQNHTTSYNIIEHYTISYNITNIIQQHTSSHNITQHHTS